MIISDGHGTRCPGTDEIIFFHGTSETRYFLCFVLFWFVLNRRCSRPKRPMQDKRKAKSCPRGMNHLLRPPRVSFPPVRRDEIFSRSRPVPSRTHH
jgi:hypothetical protein